MPALDQAFLASMQQGLTELAIAYGTDASLDIAFVVFLRRMSRFGYFTYGPISIDVRLVEGVDLDAIHARYGIDAWTRYGDDLQRFVDAGLLVHDLGRLRLTRRGMLLAHEVMTVFV